MIISTVLNIFHLEIENLAQYSWYHGYISRLEAERRLKSVGYDCFLIRSRRPAYSTFCLSLKQNKSLIHLLFQGGPRQGYNIPGADKVFYHLADVVKHCRKTPIILPNGEGVITFPCPQPKSSDIIAVKETEKHNKTGEDCNVFNDRGVYTMPTKVHLSLLVLLVFCLNFCCVKRIRKTPTRERKN